MGGPQFLLVEHGGGLERSKRGLGGVFLAKNKKLSLDIFWYYV